MKKRIVSVIQYIFFLCIGLLLLYLVFRKLDMALVWEEIRSAHYEWLLLSIFFGVLSHIVRAIRWNILIKSLGYETQTDITFYSVMVGYLANSAFPRLGEVTRCAVLSKKSGVPFNSLFGTVISERVFDLFVLILILVAVVFFQLDFLKGFVDKYFLSSIEGYFNAQSVLVLVLIALAVILLPLILFRLFFEKIKHFVLYKKVSDFVRGLFEGVKTIMKMKHKLEFILLTILLWGFYVLMTFVAFFAIDATSGLNFLDGITIMAIGSLGIVAPVPAGIGAYQFIVKAILVEIYLIPSEPAASFSIIMWITQVILILGVGALSYYMLLMKKNVKNEKDPDRDT